MKLSELIIKPMNPKRIPIQYLEGSLFEYNDYLKRVQNDGMPLMEAAIDRYLPMIEMFKTLDEFKESRDRISNYYDNAKENLDWSNNCS